ncbi:MAG TPA: thioredoxin, partial [Sphingopyxis terrae]|nr:thioredoxin [Sphingopyxis terrae]
PPPQAFAVPEAEPRVIPASEAEPPLPFRRARRNPAKRWTMIAAAAALLMIGATGALYWFGLPGWAQGLG